jgi:hypothetical protein
MIPCPNCRADMAVQSLDGNMTPRPIEIDACSSCCLFWFDAMESLQLTPRAVLGLFQYIGTVKPTARTPLSSNFHCPRCASALAVTQDLQRTTRFTYWRCMRDRGHLITFEQFLREKNFIRSPSPAELAHLRDTIRQISCSQCGASIDLATDSACRHCGAAISLVDPDGIAKAVHDLTTEPTSASAAMGSAGQTDSSIRLNDAQVNAIFDAARMNDSDRDDDLLAMGLSAVGAVLAGLLSGR